MTREIHVVVGGQFGSEAKGHVTQWLCRNLKGGVFNIRTGGPNAGHTAYANGSGVAFKFRQLPVGALQSGVLLGIAAGSEIDLDVLRREIEDVEAAGFQLSHRLFIDPEATIVEQRHIVAEADMNARIGSTAKGIGAARSDRIMRTALRFGDVNPYNPIASVQMMPISDQVRLFMRSSGTIGLRAVVIEGTQGHGLGLHAGYYPYCTSGDVDTVHQLAACNLYPGEFRIQPWVVLRTYPIRVAGNSGPMVDEINFTELSARLGHPVDPERTTVTNRIRRIGEWDGPLARSAVAANGGQLANVVLTFVDYWYPDLRGATVPPDPAHPFWVRIRQVEDEVGTRVFAVSTGPTTMFALMPEAQI